MATRNLRLVPFNWGDTLVHGLPTAGILVERRQRLGRLHIQISGRVTMIPHSDASKSDLPRKLKKDSILEAICELRFESEELEEVVLGRLIDSEPWSQFQRNRLPASNIPTAIRNTDPNLKYQPTLELKSPNATQMVKIGSNSISLHVLKPYCGWGKFREFLHTLVDNLFDKLTKPNVTRIGLRYVNALTPSEHFIESTASLNLTISVGGSELTRPCNLNYLRSEPDHAALVRIASPNFVTGSTLPPDFSALIDIDVFTADNFLTSDSGLIKNWLETAHDTEKSEFFKLLPPAILEKLVEE